MPYTIRAMRKTSVYLDDARAERLARLAREEGRSQADILRSLTLLPRIVSSDERHFRAVRPRNGEAFAILPADA